MRDVLLYGLGDVYTLTTPKGKKTFSDEAEYNKYKDYVKQYDTAYGLAYTYNLSAPNWSDFEAGNGEAVIAQYRANVAGKSQVNNGTYITADNDVKYSILLPVDGNQYFKTSDKAEYEKYTRYVALYNECYAIAAKYGFAAPVWAQFAAGQGENVLLQYKTLEANKLTADKEEAARIAAAAAERAKAEADAQAAQSAATLEVKAAQSAGDAAAAQSAQQNLVLAMQKLAETQQAAQVAQVADVTYEAPATTSTTQTTQKGGIPWWGWALGFVGGGILLYKVFGGKKK